MLSNFLIVSYNLYEKKCVAFCVFYMTFYNLHRNSVKLRPNAGNGISETIELKSFLGGMCGHA